MLLFRMPTKFFFGKVSQNLKLLNLKLPTNQQQIKTKYRQLAKQYHPDTLKQKSNKQSEQLFIKITTAYNELKQIDDKQLSNESSDDYNINISAADKQKIKTKDEIMREQTYEYFRRRDTYASMKKDQPNDKPLYKTVPELFIGTAFVIIMFGQWIYLSFIKTNKQVQKVQQKRESMMYENVFKGFNAAKRFGTAQNPVLVKREIE